MVSESSIQIGSESNYCAHVTLIRKAGEGVLPSLPRVAWPVDEWLLVRSTLSRDGPAYETLAAFPLDG